MRLTQTKLYSLATPLALLPLLDFSLSEIPQWFLGTEFRTLISAILIQVFSDLADVLIASAFALTLG